MTTKARTLVLALAALLAIGCKKEGAAKPADVATDVAGKGPGGKGKGDGKDPRPGEERSVDTRGAGPAPAPEVTLVDAGKAPLRPLRVKPSVGAAQSLLMTMKMVMEMDAGPAMQVPRTALPVMKLTMDAKVTEVGKDGDARYEFVLGEAEVVDGPGANPMMVEAMRKSLTGMKGLSGHAVVSPRNFTREANIVVPLTADPTLRQFMDGMKQSMNQLSAPFPEEAVGVGAKWRVKTALVQSGITLEQVAAYEITAMEGDRVSAKVSIDQKAQPQEIKGPQVPAGVKMSVVSMTSKGVGEIALDLARLLPPRVSLSLASDARMSVDAGGQHQAMNMKLEMDVTMEAK